MTSPSKGSRVGGSWTGYLTRDPELRYSANGLAVMTTEVAIQAQLWEVIAFGPVAEKAAKQLFEGNRVTITGRPDRIIAEDFALVEDDDEPF